MAFSFREFIDESFPIFTSAIVVWLVMRFWAGASGTVASAFAIIAALVASSLLFPSMIKRMKEKHHA